MCVDSPQSCVDGVQYAMASGDYEKVGLQVSVCACVCVLPLVGVAKLEAVRVSGSQPQVWVPASGGGYLHCCSVATSTAVQWLPPLLFSGYLHCCSVATSTAVQWLPPLLFSGIGSGPSWDCSYEKGSVT